MREEGFLRKLKMVLEINAEIKTIVSRLKGGGVFRIMFFLMLFNLRIKLY